VLRNTDMWVNNQIKCECCYKFDFKKLVLDITKDPDLQKKHTFPTDVETM
jgi:hypothetical protein